MGIRLVQARVLQFTDPEGIPRTRLKGEEVNLTDSDEARFDALVTVLAPVGATLADVENRQDLTEQEWRPSETGHGGAPPQRGPVGWQ